jgi:hypothetical protein
MENKILRRKGEKAARKQKMEFDLRGGGFVRPSCCSLLINMI